MNIQEFVRNNPTLVTMKESRSYPGLYVLKYTRKVFYDNLWTPELELCRGLVVDSAFNIQIRPFTKVYNRGERSTDFDTGASVTAVEKRNGFMAAVTFIPEHGCVVSTTGSLDSDFVQLAKQYLQKFYSYIQAQHQVRTQAGKPNRTWLFEICSPSDPHIIEEVEGAYLIGCQEVSLRDVRENERTLDLHAIQMGALRPYWRIMHFGALIPIVTECKHEGFMVYDDKGNALKMKSPYYLVTKALARGNFEKICANAKTRIDEEFYPLLEYLKVLEKDEGFSDKSEQEKISIIRNYYA